MAELKLVNKEEALLRVDNDKELYEDLLSMFFDNPQFDPEDLKKLIAEEQNEAAAKLVHLLKGISGTLGGELLYTACQSLEDILRGKKAGDIAAGEEEVISLFYKTSEELKRVRDSL